MCGEHSQDLNLNSKNHKVQKNCKAQIPKLVFTDTKKNTVQML